MDAFNYFVFVILPLFILGFQALLLGVLFFLKARGWLQSYAFTIAGFVTGLGFGYGYATLSGSQGMIVSVCVGIFGALSGLCWWYLLVKRLSIDTKGAT